MIQKKYVVELTDITDDSSIKYSTIMVLPDVNFEYTDMQMVKESISEHILFLIGCLNEEKDNVKKEMENLND